jgi:hypothetical protein
MKKRKILCVVLALFFIMGALGCATTSQPKTTEEKLDAALDAYLVARGQFNDFMQSYLAYKAVLTPEQQVSLGEQVIPKFEAADTVLDNWQDVVINGGFGYGNEQLWLSVKKDLVTILLQTGIIKIEEK